MSGTKIGSEIIFGVGAMLGIAAARALRNSSFDLAGKTIFISGGSRGLAHEFASRGPKVAISGRDREALARAADSLRLLPSAQHDVRDREPKTGKESFSQVSPSWVTALNERAAEQNNQVP